MTEIIVTDLDLFSKRHILPLEMKKKWVEALKSEKFEHGKFYLCKDNKFCCLGVLCEIEGIAREEKQLYENIGSTWFYGNDIKDDGLLTDERLMQYIGQDGNFIGFLIRKNGVDYPSLTTLNDSEEDFKGVCHVIEILF